MIAIQRIDFNQPRHELSLPANLRPTYTSHWDIYAMVGPYDEGYIVSEDIEMIYNTTWYVVASSSDCVNQESTAHRFLLGTCHTTLPGVVFGSSVLRQDLPEKMAARAANTPAT